jgi:hypothetical protein
MQPERSTRKLRSKAMNPGLIFETPEVIFACYGYQSIELAAKEWLLAVSCVWNWRKPRMHYAFVPLGKVLAGRSPPRHKGTKTINQAISGALTL